MGQTPFAQCRSIQGKPKGTQQAAFYEGERQGSLPRWKLLELFEIIKNTLLFGFMMSILCVKCIWIDFSPDPYLYSGEVRPMKFPDYGPNAVHLGFLKSSAWLLREWSLITVKGGGGGLQNRKGGQVKVLPLQKKGDGQKKSKSCWRGAGIRSFKVVLTWELEVLAILMGGIKSFHPLKGDCEKFYPVLEFWTPDFPIFVAPLPIINDRSLSI